MYKQKALIYLLIVVTLLLAACSEPANPEPPAPELIAPTAIPTPVPTKALEEATEIDGGDETPTLPDLQGRELTIAVENAYLPFNFIRPETGEADGLDYDLMSELCQRLNCVPVWVQTTWDAVIPSVAEGRYDMAAGGITHTEERAEIVAFSDSCLDVDQRLLVRAGEDRFTDASDFASVPSLVLGVAEQIGPANYPTAVDIVGPDRVRYYDGSDILVQALLNGEIDAAVVDVIEDIVYPGAAGDGLKLVGSPLSSDYLGLIFSQDSNDVEAFNQAIASLRSDGTFEKLVHKWFDPSFSLTYEEIDSGAYSQE